MDEVQYAPGLFRHLKVAVDTRPASNGQILLTGSQKFTLMKSVSESLAGRADIVELDALSLAGIRAALPHTQREAAIAGGAFRELPANPTVAQAHIQNREPATS